MTFKELIAITPEDQRYELEERAAIHEFDGGLSRTEAEIRTTKSHQKSFWDRLRHEADLL
jgi:hypothetical protein